MTERYPWEDQSVLVTGGAGLIGSALIWALNRLGCTKIVVCDLLGTSEKWRNLAPLCFDDYLEGDDLLSALENGRLPGFQHLFHLGACSATTERDSSYLVKNNFEFTKSLASWSLRNEVRFTYASSAATYGDGAAGMEDRTDAEYLETLRPLNAYGWSKHLFDLHALRRGWLPHLVGLKYFNVFGPNEDHKGDMRSVVHKAFEQVRDQGGIQLFKSYRPEYADGGQQRDFLYVKDAVAMTLHLASQPQAGGLFNIGSGRAHTWLDLANAVFGAMDLEPRIEFIEMPEGLRERYQYFTLADIGRLREAGWDREAISLKDSVSDYVGEYLKSGRHLGDAPGAIGEIQTRRMQVD